MKQILSVLVAMLSVSSVVFAYTWVNQTVQVQDRSTGRMFNTILWAYTLADPQRPCFNQDGFSILDVAFIDFFSLEENMQIYHDEFCHPTLPNILVEFACPQDINLNGVPVIQFGNFAGLFLFDCSSVGMRCIQNACF